MKHAIRTQWLPNPNQGRREFPHAIWSSNEPLIHYKSEDSLDAR